MIDDTDRDAVIFEITELHQFLITVCDGRTQMKQFSYE
jgi:hypothetical protein